METVTWNIFSYVLSSIFHSYVNIASVFTQYTLATHMMKNIKSMF